MHHFFVMPQQVQPPEIMIEGGDVNHIKNVLRMKIGESIEISDGSAKIYVGEISSFEEGIVKVQIKQELEKNTELPSKIYLFQGLPKSDKMELIVQKAVELGVYEIIPMVTKRAVVKLDDKKAKKKVERWNQIAISGAKQSGRTIIPKVTEVMNFQQALLKADELKMKFIPYELAEGMEETRKCISSIMPGDSVAVFIGPEGGFEKEEVEQAIKMGCNDITLGKRILRTETAGLACLSILMYHLEDSL